MTDILTVAQLSNALRLTVEETFAYVTIEGEVGRVSTPASGHVYFDLKDQSQPNCLLAAVMWRSTNPTARAVIQEGTLIHATGKLTTFAGQSKYQIVVTSAKIAGEGALLKLLAERKKKLAAEGLFDEIRKRSLPFLPSHIGIITSPTGAVISDMLHRIQARCPRKVTLWPSKVQGEGAEAELIKGIEGFNNLPENQRPDVLILARGGGSLEDLMAFNDEAVTRAVAASQIPIISAVGHEPDVSLTDFAADYRAPTPTAAAEATVPVKTDLLYTLEQHQNRLTQTLKTQLQAKTQLLDLFAAKLPDVHTLTNQSKQHLSFLAAALRQNINNHLKNKDNFLKYQQKILETLAPDAPLHRGYLYATSPAGTPVTSAKTQEKSITLHFKDGTRQADLLK